MHIIPNSFAKFNHFFENNIDFVWNFLKILNIDTI